MCDCELEVSFVEICVVVDGFIVWVCEWMFVDLVLCE